MNSSASSFSIESAVDFGRYNFVLLSIPGSIPWAMCLFANYRRDNIYHHMVFTEIFDNYSHDVPVSSIQTISDILSRNGIGKSMLPFNNIDTATIVDRLFGIVYLFGFEQPNVSKLSALHKQYKYLMLQKKQNKFVFLKSMMKQYIKTNAIKVNVAYNLIFYHENIAMFLSICFGISRFVSCILMPIILFFVLKSVDADVMSLHIVQNWVVYMFLALYTLSFVPFAYNIYCIINCEYYFFLVTPIKTPIEKQIDGNKEENAQSKMLMHRNVLPDFIQNTKRNKEIWNRVDDKNIASVIIQYLPVL